MNRVFFQSIIPSGIQKRENSLGCLKNRRCVKSRGKGSPVHESVTGFLRLESEGLPLKFRWKIRNARLIEVTEPVHFREAGFPVGWGGVKMFGEKN